MYIRDSTYLNLMIMNKLHAKPYSRHSGYSKMVTSIWKQYYWPNMKREITNLLPNVSNSKNSK